MSRRNQAAPWRDHDPQPKSVRDTPCYCSRLDLPHRHTLGDHNPRQETTR